MAKKPVRRLPVLRPSENDAGESRPRWQWVAFGALLVIFAWLPFSYLAEVFRHRVVVGVIGTAPDPGALSARLSEMSPSGRFWLSFALTALPFAGMAGAAFAGGYVLGRWAKGAGAKEGALAGALAGAAATALSFASYGVSVVPVISIAFAAGVSAIGGGAGRARRDRERAAP